MEKVAIVSAYSTPYSMRNEMSAWEMVKSVAEGALKSADKGIYGKDIDLVIVSNFSDSFGNFLHVAPLVAGEIGATSARGFRVENACAAGGTAIYLAYNLLSAGLGKNALIVGFEKMSNVPFSSQSNEVLMRASHPEEYSVGAPYLSLYAIMAREYMRKYGAKEEDLALVAVKNHENALRNPLAALKKKVTVEDVLSSPYVSTPLKLLDSSPITDGAAALIISSEPKKITDTPVYILAAEISHDYSGLHQRSEMDAINAARKSAVSVYRRTGLNPKDFQIFEVHDAFTIAEIILYEMLGLSERGKGYLMIREMETSFEGKFPVNVSGGLKAKGHPIGATGVGMAAELFWQLRGEAGGRQVKNAERGLMENHGGTGATSVVVAFSR